MKNKKGVSEMIAYVLLIVIAITISVFVYNYLRKSVPVQSEECEDNIAIIINDYSCDIANKKINMEIKNNGLFNVRGFFIRMANETDKPAIYGFKNGGCENVIAYNGQVPKNLNVSEISNCYFYYQEFNQIMEVEIEPYLIKKVQGKEEIILCSNAFVKMPVEGCN